MIIGQINLENQFCLIQKADYMVYGMGEQAIIDLGNYLKEG